MASFGTIVKSILKHLSPRDYTCVELPTAVQNLADLCSRPQLEQPESLVLSAQSVRDTGGYVHLFQSKQNTKYRMLISKVKQTNQSATLTNRQKLIFWKFRNFLPPQQKVVDTSDIVKVFAYWSFSETGFHILRRRDCRSYFFSEETPNL